MEIDRWDPWRTFEALRRQMDEQFRHFFEQLADLEKQAEPITFSPEIDVINSAGGLIVRASLPGMIQEDIDIFVDQDMLTVRGERLPPTDAPDEAYLQREWPYGRFERSIRLPFAVDGDHIEATYSDGVLVIVLTRA